MKRLILATTVALTSSMATGAEVTWDFPFGANTNPVGEMEFGYNSQSIVTDSDGNGVISDGDAIHSYGGWGAMGFDALPSVLQGTGGYSSINENKVTGFDISPNPPLYNSAGGYIFTFFFNDLMGEWSSSLNDFTYNSGTINFGVYDFNTSTFANLFDINIFQGGILGPGQSAQIFSGEIDETSLDNGAGTGFTLTQDGKTKTLSDWLAGDLRVLFESNQTVEGALEPGAAPGSGSGLVFAAPGGEQLIAANHTGRFSLNVPEPSTIAVLGLSLIGFGAAARKRKA